MELCFLLFKCSNFLLNFSAQLAEIIAARVSGGWGWQQRAQAHSAQQQCRDRREGIAIGPTALV
jgi:hypothetical protein